MSILPTFMDQEIQTAVSAAPVLETPREYGINFETGQLTGHIVEGIEAVKVWIWGCLRTERYRYAIHSWQYGVEYEQYIGETISDEYLQSDCQVETEDALLVNPYITEIDDFSASMDGTTLKLNFIVRTIFGSLEVDTNV